MRSLLIATLLCTSFSFAALAQDAGAFEPFLKANSADCVKVADIEKAAAKAKPVKETTFRFIQALYMAIPPISHTLPPGDKAELATDKNGKIIAFITDGPMSCARFLVPDFLAKAILQVELGKTTHAGEGL